MKEKHYIDINSENTHISTLYINDGMGGGRISFPHGGLGSDRGTTTYMAYTIDSETEHSLILGNPRETLRMNLAAHRLIDLGSSESRFKTLYMVNGDFEGSVLIRGDLRVLGTVSSANSLQLTDKEILQIKAKLAEEDK